MEYDLIAKGGWVIDGTGGPAFRADVAVLNGMIFEVGHIGDLTATKVLDATNLYIVPGFIDAHVHGDLMLLADPIHLPALRQGVTTYIIGQDGCSFAPGSRSTIDYMRRYTAGFNGNPTTIEYDWNGVEEYLARFDRRVAINVAYLIPNGNVRIEVMGHDPRPATDDELKAMQRLVREGMDAGAVGLSTGLDYLPSRHADAREIAALCEAIVPDDGVYVTHMRAYGQNAAIGMEEVYEIARLSGVAAHISHYNGPADNHAYRSSTGAWRWASTSPTTPIPISPGAPSWGWSPCRPGSRRAGSTRPSNAWPTPRSGLGSNRNGSRPRRNTRSKRCTWRWSPIQNGDGPRGSTVVEAASKAGLKPGDFVREILIASEMAVGVVNFRANDRTEEDVRAILRHPSHMAGSDGIFRGGFPHPRGWGAFARYLGYHTRTLGDYTWPEAITHLTTHAARRYRLTDRGLVRPGYVADLAILNPKTVTDRSTYEAGRTLAEGVKHVIVNGVLALEDGEPTGATPGRALRRG